MDDLHANTFAPHQGTTFTATRDGTTVPLVLAEVEEVTSREGAPRQDPFSLMFTGPAGTTYTQGMFVLEHDKLGRLEIFLVPREPEADGLPRLEGLFN